MGYWQCPHPLQALSGLRGMASNPRSTALVAEGMALLRERRMPEADQRFRDAYALDTQNAQAPLGLGLIAHQTGNFVLALDFFDRALAIDASDAATHVNRGNSLAALQRHADAVGAFQTALSLSADLASALINMATALHALGKLDDAVAALERAAGLQSASPELLNNLGNLYKDQGRLAAALNCYELALALQPMMQQAFSNKLAALKTHHSMTPADILNQHQQWSNWFEAVSAYAPRLTNVPEPSKRLRIGYVSPDCHTALPAFIDGVIAGHDRERFQVFCYFNNPQSPLKLAALAIADTARVMRGLDDQQVATLIHADAIDILIDIAGHTGHNRLGVFARRPAPVQMTWLDYLCTTGLGAMDYRITDAVADPPGNERFHSEQLLRMPHSQWCWQPDADAPAVVVPPAAQRDYITFGSFNNAQKLTDATLALWRGLLEALPDAQLCVAGIADGYSRDRVREGLGCDASRLRFLPRLRTADYRDAYRDVDIALDPMPFSGATTTLDALWQGVPVLTLPGARSCSRSTASLLTALKLEEWIATDEADFVARAQRLAADRQTLLALRKALRERMRVSPILDQPRFTDELEKIYRQAWQAWCKKIAEDNEGITAKIDAASADLAAGRHDEALVRLHAILKARPHWELAKRELVRACMAWSRANMNALAAWQQPFKAVAARQKISAIICSIRADYFAAIKAKLTEQFARHDFEVIGIHDAKSLCEGYNRGAATAKGDMLIFCHDDIDMVIADFGERVLAHLAKYDVVGVAGASRLVDADWGHAGLPYVHGQIIHKPPGQADYLYFCAGLQAVVVENIQALDGVFIAAHRKVWVALKFDEETFNAFHVYDIDFTYRAHLAGYREVVAMDLPLIHFSTGGYDLKWQAENLKFLRKFPQMSNLPTIHRYSNLQVKLKTLDQVTQLHSALLHQRFGE